jgi:hypothetical protein
MPTTKRILRMTSWMIVGLCAISLILAVAIHVDQYLLRRRAERLLSDLKSLEMRKSTYQDARQVMDRWKDSIHQEGPCQPYRCDVQISPFDFFNRHWRFLVDHQRLMRVYRVLGGRPAMIDGSIGVRKNIVWGKGIFAMVESPSADHEDGIELVVRAGSGSPSSISPLHPEYEMGVGHPITGTPTVGAYAVFTPYADPADVKRLMDIDFSCLTRWHPCETGADIVPTAWNEAAAEREKRVTRNSAAKTCSPDVLRVLGRESRRAVIGEVTRLESFSGSTFSTGSVVKVLLKDDLKPCNFSFLTVLQDYSFSESLPVKEKLGDRYILFFIYKEPYLDEDGACALLPATDENIETVGRGVSEDLKDHDNELLPSPGLRDLKPPTIGVR